MHPLGARTREDMKERIMDRTQYTNLAKAWEFTEEHARERESDALTDTRTAADESGQLQGSAAQARLLGMLVRITGAASVIAVGTGSLVETLQLAHALDNKGLLTAVDSTAQGIALIRKAFAELQDETDTTLRAVNAPASVFLPRLNANDYDLIVVAGDAENYAATFAQASRLLRVHGVIVFTDVLALEDGQGGVINPADRSDNNVEHRDAQRIQHRIAIIEVQPGGDNQAADDKQQEEALHLSVFKQLLRAAFTQRGDKQQKWQTTKEHKQGCDPV